MRRIIGNLLKVGVILSISASVFSTTINVPADQPTIRAGVEAAVEGDTVLVADGIYTGKQNRNIYLNEKNIVLKSKNGPDATIIDCESSQRAFYIDKMTSDPDIDNLIIDGFTITNGQAYHGAAMNFKGDIVSPIIRNCRIINSVGLSAEGSAIYIRRSSPIFQNCYFGNNISSYGGAMRVSQSGYPQIIGSVFEKNIGTVRGGAIRFDADGATSLIKNCTFYDNSSPIGSAIDFAGTAPVDVQNSIIAFNINGPAISGVTSPLMTCTDIFGNFDGDFTGIIEHYLGIDGNFSSNPLFFDTSCSNFDVDFDSPCLPENNDCGVQLGAIDFGCIFFCGDGNESGNINILDIVLLINYKYKDGPPPNPLESGDVNDDAEIDVLDVIYLINWLYKDGPGPIC